MNNRRANLAGRTFGKLHPTRVTRVVPYAEHSKKVFWECSCDCGKICEVWASNLVNGNTRSCGCLRGKRIAPVLHPLASRSAERMAWSNMWLRTSDTYIRPQNYKGRGITVCERWKDFLSFLEDVGPRPSPKHSLDRWPNNDGNYEPGNVRWATAKEQYHNSRRKAASRGDLSPVRTENS